MSDDRLMIEHLRLEDDQKNFVRPGRLGWIGLDDERDFTAPTAEQIPAGATIGYGLLIDSEGQLAPGIVIRDSSGRALAGVQLDLVEQLELGSWALQTGTLSGRRLSRHNSGAAQAFAESKRAAVYSLFSEDIEAIREEIRAELTRELARKQVATVLADAAATLDDDPAKQAEALLELAARLQDG
ncbi:MAG: hypothetical protein U9Q81_12015 [Pseudomonadota bacterium]|nr:hypothetical protein [Pseudomonadota bacterium]